VIKQHEILWKKIQAFPLDEPQASFPFSKKLAKENGWTQSFALQAMAEYKKFLLLCCISPTGASPSPVVDAVWHLHLTYTQSYWRHLCTDTLNTQLHHHPSRGGPQENEKHTHWYSETLSLYYKTFGEYPPTNIWPAYIESTVFDAPEPTYTPLQPDGATWQKIGFTLAVFLLLLLIRFQSLNPYHYKGPAFLEFTVYLCCTAMFVAVFLFRYHKQNLLQVVDEHYPARYSIYQGVHFLYGKHRALQTAIIHLLKKDGLEVQETKFVNKIDHAGPGSETNPLYQPLQQYPIGRALRYEELENDLYAHQVFSHPSFEKLSTVAAQKHRWHRLPYFIVLGILLLRFQQGLANGKPVGYLFMETFIFTIAYLLLTQKFSNDRIIYEAVKERFDQENIRQFDLEENDEVLKTFSHQGCAAIKDFSEFALLSVLFAPYPVLHRQANGQGSYSGCGSDGGSNCGGDGGGGCGGGCGGCGGGD